MSKKSEKKELKRERKKLHALHPIRKDHYVPVCYQRGFTDSHHKLWVWQKKKCDKPIAYKYPAQICWENLYYEVKDSELLKRFDQNDPKVIESKAFAKYEDSIQRLVDWFDMGVQAISRQDFVILCHGYLLQKQRVPAYATGLEQLDRKQRSNLVRVAIQNVRANFEAGTKNSPDYQRLIDHPTLKHLLSDEYWQTVTDKSLAIPIDWHHTQLHGLLSSSTGSNLAMSNALGRLSLMQLNILRAPEGHFFLTSDNPGFSFVEKMDQPGTVVTANTSFLNNIGIYFPISSKLALCIRLGEQQDLYAQECKVHYFDVDENDIKAFNDDTIMWADRIVMGVDKEYLNGYVQRLYFRAEK